MRVKRTCVSVKIIFSHHPHYHKTNIPLPPVPTTVTNNKEYKNNKMERESLKICNNNIPKTI